jgi:hypothetical protein
MDMNISDGEVLRRVVARAVAETPVTDIHTHLYPPGFGRLLLWGIDELLTYHYLVAETFRSAHISKTLFIDASPISEACRGVLTVLAKLGLDVGSRDLASYRRSFAARSASGYVDEVLALSRVETVVMTNDPFNDSERALWLQGRQEDGRFRPALRLDALLNAWESAWPRLREWGYEVERRLTAKSLAGVRRFLGEWAERMGALYCAVSLPPSFRFPGSSASLGLPFGSEPQGRRLAPNSGRHPAEAGGSRGGAQPIDPEGPRSTLLRECVLPVCAERNLPLALMIGVKKRTNPALGDAGDSVGKGDIDTVEQLCATCPQNKFLVTMLARENQHELCVAARKFPNLLVFGCWWFLNNPSLVEEVTRMRLELLGTSVIPQHSDARVLDQLIYKWEHAKATITEVLLDKYRDLMATGWRLSEEEVRRDVGSLFGGNFWAFLKKKLA